jgi:hypothetical protein
MRFSHRLHEWIADRVSWVQYPDLRPADEFTRQASRSTSIFSKPRVKVSPLLAILLGLGGLVSILVGLAVLSGVALFVYLLIKAG